MTTSNSQTLAKRPDLSAAIAIIDETTKALAPLFGKTETFAEELAMARGMQDLRLALTPDVMAPIMSLMNSPLGFVTDQNPNLTNPKTNQPYVPYTADIVRDCFIESKLRGFHTIGNEWNIISSRFYAAKAGLRRKVLQHPGLTEFADVYEVPRMVQDKGAIVKCRASWKLNGQPATLEREFPIRVNAYMGADAILGKAERKLVAAVLARVTGANVPHGDAAYGPDSDATIDVETKTTPRRERAQRETTPAAPATTAEPPAATEGAQPPADPQAQQEPAAANIRKMPTAPAATQTPQENLAALILAAGHNFDDYLRAVRHAKLLPMNLEPAGFDEIPAEFAKRHLRVVDTITDAIALDKGGL